MKSDALSIAIYIGVLLTILAAVYAIGGFGFIFFKYIRNNYTFNNSSGGGKTNKKIKRTHKI